MNELWIQDDGLNNLNNVTEDQFRLTEGLIKSQLLSPDGLLL